MRRVPQQNAGHSREGGGSEPHKEAVIKGTMWAVVVDCASKVPQALEERKCLPEAC